MRISFWLSPQDELGYSGSYIYESVSLEWEPLRYTPMLIGFITAYPTINASIDWTMLDGRPL